MQFQFESWQAFFAMGGHGPYVWAAYVVGLLLLTWLVLNPLQKHRSLLKQYRIRLYQEALAATVTKETEVS